jgi:DNA-binding SARP family transcriptional activator
MHRCTKRSYASAVLVGHVLGGTEVEADGVPLDLGGPLPRRLVAALLSAEGRAVSEDALAAAIWGAEVPANPTASLQAYVSRLRRILGRDALVRAGDGYRIAVDDTDAARFAADVARGRELLDDERPGEALRAFDTALSRWRGEAFADLPEAYARTHLTELRDIAAEERLAARLATGDAPGVVGDLDAAVRAEPYRERRWELLILALYRSGRQADALAAYARARAALVEDLGIEPGAALPRLESDILRRSPALDRPPPAGIPATSATRDARPATAGDAGPPAVYQDGPGGGGPGPGPLVGRDAELDTVERVLAEGGGRLVLVSGGPGIGKSALLAEIAARAAARGFAVGAAGGVDGRPPPVFLPWAQALRGVAGSADEQALAGAFAPHGNLPAVLDPALAEVLALPAPEPLADAELARSRLLQGIVDGLRRLSAGVPVLLVLDDAHHLDNPSTTLLTLCNHALPGTGITLAVGFRPGEIAAGAPVADALTALASSAHAVHLRLEGLSTADVAALGARVTQRTLPDETVRVLVDRTGGNPFLSTHCAWPGSSATRRRPNGRPRGCVFNKTDVRFGCENRTPRFGPPCAAEDWRRNHELDGRGAPPWRASTPSEPRAS